MLASNNCSTCGAFGMTTCVFYCADVIYRKFLASVSLNYLLIDKMTDDRRLMNLNE